MGKNTLDIVWIGFMNEKRLQATVFSKKTKNTCGKDLVVVIMAIILMVA